MKMAVRIETNVTDADAMSVGFSDLMRLGNVI
jgi:hypothetical protein